MYAKSLFQLAEERGGRELLETTLGELEDVLELARQDPRFSEFLASRVIPAEQRARSLERIFKGRSGDLTLRFLMLLNDNGRLSHLPRIVAALDQLVQQRFGRVEVDVYTASPVSADELRGIREKIQAKLGREPIVPPYVDPRMIGGIKVQIGDQLIDGSVATQLRRMKEQLAERGLAAMRARFGSAVSE
ncbi:ATP synthase F1 subunit delta [Leptolyngbya sp. 15MV]|nr:ATP synthase F1 subunit delta [Leptolyngbya sp. 15MV]